MTEFTNYKQKIILDGIKNDLLIPRYLLLLQTDNQEYVGFRVTRARQSFINYSFTDDIAGFSSLTSQQFENNITLAIKELTGVTDWLATNIDRSSNNVMQIFYGIKPSYAYASIEYGGPGQYQTQMPVSAVLPRSSYPYIYDNNGFNSPYFAPAEGTEFYVINGVDVEFTLYNSVNIPINPGMLFVVNNMLVEPVEQGTFKKMLLGTVPRRLASPGQIYSTVAYSGSGYNNVTPVSVADVLKQNVSALKSAGYPEGGN